MKQQTITVSGRGRKEKENSAYNSTKCFMQNFSNYKGLSTINPESEKTHSHTQNYHHVSLIQIIQSPKLVQWSRTIVITLIF